MAARVLANAVREQELASRERQRLEASRERQRPEERARELRSLTLPARLWERLVGPFRRGAPPPPRPATGFYTDTTVCIGCKACEVACKQWNQLPADGFNWTGNSYDNTEELSAKSWRHVKFIEQFPLTPLTPTPLPSGPSGERGGRETAPLPNGANG